MTFREILAALTTTPAAIIGGAAPTGRIAPGQPADFVVLDGDPSQTFERLPTCAIRLGTERSFTCSAQWAWYYSA